MKKVTEAASVYVPTAEDFVPVSSERKTDTSAESVGGSRHDTVKKFFAQKSAVVGVVILALLVIMSIIGPYLSGYDYAEQELDRSNLAPKVPVFSEMGFLNGSELLPKTTGDTSHNRYEELGISDVYYIFGTDSLGRDMFSRCFMGLRISLIIAVVSTLINLFIGMNYGIISGYFGGMADVIMQRIADVIGSIPTLVVVTLLMLVMEPGMGSIILALMLSGWIEMSQIARAQVLNVKEMEYIQAARTLGAGHSHIIFGEILPNIIGKMITQIMISIPAAVFLEAFLSFVGLGMPPGSCSLGTLLSDGFKSVLIHPYQLIPSAILMILIIVGSHLVANGLKKAAE